MAPSDGLATGVVARLTVGGKVSYTDHGFVQAECACTPHPSPTERNVPVLSLLDAFPLLLLLVVAFMIFVFGFGGADAGALDAPVLSMTIVSGDRLAFTTGDLFLLAGIFLLFIEVLKSTHTGTVTLLNHGFSTGVLILCVILFLVAPGFGNATFLLITFMTMFDVTAGFVITIVAARRDLAVR